jgi:CheY-specific phosphatase CheX
MRALYVNPVITSLSTVLQMLAQVTAKKGSALKTEGIETDKEYTIVMNVSGELNGYFAFSFTEETALSIVNAMTAGMGTPSELDELGLSCINEFGGMTRGNVINALTEVGFTCEVNETELCKKDSLPFYPPETALKFHFETEIGEFELHICLYK